MAKRKDSDKSADRDDGIDLQPAQQTFVAESRDLLRDMESALLKLEKDPRDREALDAVFRAAHTIKGSAGVFDFTDIIELTHAMESVLVELRAGRLTGDGDLVALLLSCGDHLALLVERVGSGETAGAAELAVAARTLSEQLAAYVGAAPGEPAAPPAVPQASVPQTHESEVETLDSKRVAADTWHISVRFGPDVLRNGMDPLSILRYLGTVGDVVGVQTIPDAMPDREQMDPESCYLGLEIEFASGAADKKVIEDAFEFVRDDCRLRILPPHSRISDYVDLIANLPEDKAMVGDILVASGALTENELKDCLEWQRRQRNAGGEAGHEPPRVGEIAIGQGMTTPTVVEAALEKQRIIKEHRAVESSSLRVSAEKLDELINLVGELVIASAGTNVAAQRARDAETIEAASTLARLVEEVRDAALKLRMVPIGETFNRYHRVVRDLGRELDKDVELSLSGTETELDKSMVEKIGDPLIHLVRNAIDHGIENAELRAQRGKSPRGLIRMNAYHETGSIVIEVVDDGGGLDRDRILKRALERGLVGAGEELSDQDVYRLVMEAGFSTAEQVTNVSGRGVGMDVVKRNVEALRGSVTIDSIPGEGTTVSLRLPLTLAIIDGFLVGVGRSAYVVPLEMVQECIELSAEDATNVRETGYMNMRGEVLPLLRLRDVFDVRGEGSRRENIVVVQYGGRQAGFVVDSLLGEFQTVIKPLGRLFERLSGISGSTILGSGDVALILDAPALVQRAVSSESTGMRSRGTQVLAGSEARN